MTNSNNYPRWCDILRETAKRQGRTTPEVATAAGIGVGKLKKIWTNHDGMVPSADEMLRLCEVLDLPKTRMLAELGMIESESDREAYIEQLEELASRTTYSAGTVEIEQQHGAAFVAARIAAAGRYRVTIAPLVQGTGRFQRHYDDLLAVQPLPGQQSDDLSKELEALVRPELAWFSAGFIGMAETAKSLGLETSDPRSVIRVPQFVAIRRGSGLPPEPKPRCICVAGGHWCGSADVASWLGYAFDLDCSHIGFVASRAFGRLTHKNHDLNAYDREEVARTYALGAERLGRRRVWAVGGDNYLQTFELLAATRAREPVVVYLRVTDELIRWTAGVRTGQNEQTTKTQQRDIFDMQEERRKVDEILRNDRGLRERTVTLHVDLPFVARDSDQAADRRDAFFDMWGSLAEHALVRIHDVVNSLHGRTFDLNKAMERLRLGGLPEDNFDGSEEEQHDSGP
jgi:transcriptional regulator with XRE-family HTH domain